MRRATVSEDHQRFFAGGWKDGGIHVSAGAASAGDSLFGDIRLIAGKDDGVEESGEDFHFGVRL